MSLFAAGSMERVIGIVTALGTAWILFQACQHWTTFLRRRTIQRQSGCREPAKYPHTNSWSGSDLLTLRKVAIREGRLKLLYIDQHRELGETWRESVNGGIEINTISCANLKFMYAVRTSAFSRRSAGSTPERLLFGPGCILADGDEWKFTRRLMEPTFSKYETATMPMLKSHVDRFIGIVPRDASAFNAQPLLKMLFLDLTTEFLFGEPLGLQIPEKQAEANDFLDTLEAVVLGMNKRRQHFSITTAKLWFDKSYDANVAKAHAFVDRQVLAALARTSSEGAKAKLDNGRYILVDELAAKVRDAEWLRFAMIQTFMAGRDSPAILTSNTLFALARSPEIWTRLRALVLPLSDDQLLSFTRLSSLHPLRHVIFEALRLYGPGGRNRRVTTEDVVFPEGGGPDGKSPLFVPKGTRISTFLPALHRNKAYWGEDADEYKPERWEGFTPTGEFRPFLLGPRTCPAKDQVIVQITYILARLLREFEAIENADEVLHFVELSKMTIESRRGAQITLTPAKSH